MTSTATKGEVAVSRSGSVEVTAEQVRAAVEARLQAALDEARASGMPQTAGPALWWDMYAYGPFKAPLAPFPAPHQIVRLGETVYIASILYLNETYPYPTAADVLATFGMPYSIAWDTNNVTSLTKETNLAGILHRNFVPGQSWYVDIITLTPEHEGIHEVNLRGRITGCNGELAPPFAGYATLVFEFDSSLFTLGSHSRYQGPVRFDVYR
ncbi:MAG: hypothetical protein OHK0015_29620 [Chloroflexi bacterium OHK40]